MVIVTHVISFEEINPFIRFANFIKFPNIINGNRAAYDCKFMYIYSGKGYITIDGTTYNAVKGDLFIWNPGIVYQVFLDPGDTMTVVSINFDYTYTHKHIAEPIDPCPFDKFDPGNIHEICIFSDNIMLNQPIYVKNMQDEESTLQKIVNEFQLKNKNGRLKTRILFMSLLAKIATLVSSGNYLNETNDKVNAIINYIRQNYYQPLSNASISNHFNFNPVYLNRLMKRYTGYSLHQYLLNYRIRKALDLLHTTNKSISEIAYDVGFNDVNNFSACFRKMVGVSPKNYIKNSTIYNI